MTVYVIRHAQAGPAPDEGGALDESGRRQADRIAELLADARIERVLSSRYARCLETVTPLALRFGVVVEEHEALAEESSFEGAWALLEALAAADADVAVCSHGNLISPLLDRARRRGTAIEGEWVCRKGSIWCLEPEGTLPFARATLRQA